MDESGKKLLSRLQNQCARREYCSSDIKAKALKLFDGDADAAEEALSSLCADGFVSDLRYASAFAREKAALGGWGPVKIRFALRGKKIGEDIITEALGEIDTDKADDKLFRLLETKWRSLTTGCKTPPQDAKLKLIRFALSRGYDYETIRPVIEKL